MTSPLLLYLVTEDWYFLSHRLPMARAARDAGFRVAVATRVDKGAEAILREGFDLHALSWDRGAVSPLSLATSVAEVAALYRRLEPDLLHHVAMKPVIVGSIAARLTGRKAVVNAVTGLGSTLIPANGRLSLSGRAVRAALPVLLNRRGWDVVVQNDDDRAMLTGLGIAPDRFTVIRGSGIDIEHHAVMPEPDGPVTFGFAARMLDDKGVRPLLAAFSSLRARGLAIRLLLAGTPDPDNPTSLTEAEMQDAANSPGVTWLGHVADIRSLWAQAHVAVLPSRREGLPKALLEAAAAGRPIVATDVPGCREIARQGQNALTVPADDPEALAGAMAMLAEDGAMRRRFGMAGRTLVESDLSSTAVAQATLDLYRRSLSRT